PRATPPQVDGRAAPTRSRAHLRGFPASRSPSRGPALLPRTAAASRGGTGRGRHRAPDRERAGREAPGGWRDLHAAAPPPPPASALPIARALRRDPERERGW